MDTGKVHLRRSLVESRLRGFDDRVGGVIVSDVERWQQHLGRRSVAQIGSTIHEEVHLSPGVARSEHREDTLEARERLTIDELKRRVAVPPTSQRYGQEPPGSSALLDRLSRQIQHGGHFCH